MGAIAYAKLSGTEVMHIEYDHAVYQAPTGLRSLDGLVGALLWRPL